MVAGTEPEGSRQTAIGGKQKQAGGNYKDATLSADENCECKSTVLKIHGSEALSTGCNVASRDCAIRRVEDWSPSSEAGGRRFPGLCDVATRFTRSRRYVGRNRAGC